MTREKLASIIFWPKVFWVIGMLNPIALLAQPIKILIDKTAIGVSIEMWFLFLTIQLGFCFQGYLSRSSAQVTSMGISAIITVFTIILVFIYR